MGPPYPPKRSHTGLVVGVCVLVTLLVAGGVAAIVAFNSGDDEPSEAGAGLMSDRSTTADTTPEPPESTDPADLLEPTESLESPDPSDESEWEVDPSEVLERNPLYSAGKIGAAGCPAVSQVPIDSTGNARRFYSSMMPCLKKTWRVLAKQGIDFRAPSLVVFDGVGDSPCGGGQYSFYCPSNETIYMYATEMVNPWNQYAGDDFSHGLTRLAAVHTLAHEYAHHIQQVTGIFGAASPTPGTEVERRSELQASCLGNVFLASQRDAYPVQGDYWNAQWVGLWRYITRVPNHGTEANQALWTDRGYRSMSPSRCNTWTAPAGEVR